MLDPDHGADPGEAQSRSVQRREVRTWRAFMEVHAMVLDQIGAELERRHQLTVSEFDTLVNIPLHGARMRVLAGRVILSKSALSRLVNRLQRRALVTKGEVAGDSRGVLISLTDEGRRLRRVAARTNADVVQQAFTSRLSRPESEALGAILDRLRGPDDPEGPNGPG